MAYALKHSDHVSEIVLSCPVETAYELARAWPGAELFVCDEPGHRSSEAKREYLRAALTRFATEPGGSR